ncbi:hypothetical protein BH20ACT15_BH20ACT15_06090 [soil metagenome]
MPRLLKTLTFAAIAFGAWAWLKKLLDEPEAAVETAATPQPKQTPAPKAAPSNGSATKAELYERAQELEIAGRSKMNKAELERALRDAG